MIALLALAALPPGVVTPTIVSGQRYVCVAQSVIPRFEVKEGTVIQIDGNDWLFDADLAAVAGVPKASATLAKGELTLSAPVANDARARFEAKVVQEEGDDRVLLDWDIARPAPDEALLRSGLAVCNLSTDSVAQEKKS
jgi:hypothetical protein